MIAPHGRGHRGDVDDVEGHRQRTVFQDVRQVTGFLDVEVSFDLRLSAENGLIEPRSRHHHAVENDRERVTGGGTGPALRQRTEFGGRLGERTGSLGVELQGHDPPDALLRQLGVGVGHTYTLDEGRLHHVLLSAGLIASAQPFGRVVGCATGQVDRVDAIEGVDLGLELRAVIRCLDDLRTLSPAVARRFVSGLGGVTVSGVGIRRVDRERTEHVPHRPEVQQGGALDKLDDPVLSQTRDRDDDRRRISRTLGGHFGLGDAEAVHAGTNDLDRLCELLVSDLGSFDDGLRHQDHLGAALKVEAEADRGIGARPKGPDDATDEQDDQGDQRSPWLRCCRWCHRSPRMRMGFEPAGCRLSRSATALRLPPVPSRR